MRNDPLQSMLWRQLAMIKIPRLFRLSETQDKFCELVPMIASSCPEIDAPRDPGEEAPYGKTSRRAEFELTQK